MFSMIAIVSIYIALFLFLLGPLFLLAGGKIFKVDHLTFKKALVVNLLLLLVGVLGIIVRLSLGMPENSMVNILTLLAAFLIAIWIIKRRFKTTIPRSIGIYLTSAVFALITMSLVKSFVVQAYKIPSSTMEPTLLVGDHILVNKFTYYFKDPARGDIIVFVYPMDPKKDFVKRVISLPGEEIQLRNRRLFINGREIEDPWGVYGERGRTLIPDHLRPRDNYGPKVVPSSSLFVLGDNRDNSQDSRYWGFVERSKVKGKVSTIYFSWDRLTKRCRWERVGKTVE